MTGNKRFFRNRWIFQLTSSRRGWPVNCLSADFEQAYFNSHPHEEDDISQCFSTYSQNISTHILTKRMTVWIMQPYQTNLFQLTSSRRGWLNCCRSTNHLRRFQLTSSRRGWRQRTWFLVTKRIFQLTSSRRGWPHFWVTDKSANYFNSHPHEEDDLEYDSQLVFRFISTHILTKRMTWRISGLNDHEQISTHILTKRMTQSVFSQNPTFLFQLTSSRRGWLDAVITLNCRVCISTHILTKRMTESPLWSRTIFYISTHILTKRMTTEDMIPRN